MADDLRIRLLALVALACLGVALAVAGSSLGAGDPITGTEPSGEFTVSSDNVTFSDGDREVTAVGNLSGVERVEFTEDDGVVRVETEPTEPLTAAERDRAAALARANKTVQQYLAGVDEYEVAVEPIQKLDTTAVDIEGEQSLETGDDNATVVTFNVTETEAESGGDAVRVDREPSYLEDGANVRVYGPEGNLQYSLIVDLRADAVADLTDWDDVGDE